MGQCCSVTHQHSEHREERGAQATQRLTQSSLHARAFMQARARVRTHTWTSAGARACTHTHVLKIRTGFKTCKQGGEHTLQYLVKHTLAETSPKSCSKLIIIIIKKTQTVRLIYSLRSGAAVHRIPDAALNAPWER